MNEKEKKKAAKINWAKKKNKKKEGTKNKNKKNAIAKLGEVCTHSK